MDVTSGSTFVSFWHTLMAFRERRRWETNTMVLFFLRALGPLLIPTLLDSAAPKASCPISLVAPTAWKAANSK